MGATLRDVIAMAKPKLGTLSDVTKNAENPAVRRAARLLALLPAMLVTSATGTAFADPPDTWEDNTAVSGLHVILVLVLIPLALFALIWLLVYLPSMSKGAGYHPGLAWRNEPVWFGGPRGGVDALDHDQPATVGSGHGAGDADETRGGASGRW
jgi:hypothetical protein